MAMDIDARVMAACAAALALTLVLAAWLTPRSWWRRPNLRALAVLGGGTFAFAALFLGLTGKPAALPPPAALAALATMPAAGVRYLVVDDLNLRDGAGVRARRVAVLRAGSAVTATGATDGDWWRVRADVDGQAREGWASSLWLRRADERRQR
jgi:uncharacterized protein YgiM (DUF1202 family)